MPTETGTWIVTKLGQFFEVGLIGASIITGKENQGIFIDSGFFDCSE